jgi:hypothetical protein
VGLSLTARPGISHGAFLTFTRFGRKVVGNNSTSLFLELTLEELVFLLHKYYSIFLLQQEASAL